MMSPCSQFPEELRPGDFVPKKHLRLGYLSSSVVVVVDDVVVVVVVVVVEVLLLVVLL